MTEVNAALGAIFLLILLGYSLQRANIPGADFWPQMERLTYYVLFPALLFDKLSNAVFVGLALWPMVATLAVMLLVASAY
jgi:predicted permease